ncbi:WSC-domain-containing protein [Trichodelitschia bisporula]|uniref:WSC-domain-containing protein n=1 Tax=Trichodelitschia bisporula TaxID=703511 RepID=A0A6G1I291_9PEZI|nr:WSC-domain-containing protein [Trichodelitschia bisporula]
MAFFHSFLDPSTWSVLSLILLSFFRPVISLGASTDTITWGGDNSRCGYQSNHNMDPSVVGSVNFGQIFNAQLPGNFNGIGPEQIFSQPLLFTGNDSVQYIYVATTQNNLYKLDAKTGAIIARRNLHVPFLTADLDGCVDINPTVGVTATGAIDSDTGIWYLTAKTYSSQFQGGGFSPTNPPGRLNGRYFFHGIDTQSPNLTDIFQPVPLDGVVFRNNPNRMMVGGNQHSRPGLVIVGNYVYTGYASHCVQYNFTGAIIGHDKRTGVVVEALATEGGPEPNTVKGGGVWMSGGGISYDGAGSLFFATGNGYASQLAGIPVPGRQPPSALEEAAVNAKINSDGTLSVIDFFMPWEKQQLDGADKDLGTTPLELLPTDVFACSNVKRMGVVTGKSGKTYVLNLDNLGGYQMGPNKLDAVVFTYQNENSVYAGAGVMPLGGGYIYINVIKYRTRVFKFSCDDSGNPQFTVVAYTPEFNANILGTGHGTTTSLNGQPGTGLYWVSDVEGLNLRIYDAIPQNGNNLALIRSFNAPGITKFTRPVFGNGRVYLGTTTGALYGFGCPVNLPLNCSSPYQFGNAALNSTSNPITITCVALVPLTILGNSLAGNPNFVVSNLPPAESSFNAGQTFRFQASFSPKTVGPLSSDVIINTTSQTAGYSTTTPITLQGNGISAAPLLAVNPNTISFNVIVGEATGGLNQTAIISNLGNSLLRLQNISYSTVSETGPFITPNVTSAGVQVGPFTFINVPQSISANSATTILVNYNPTSTGNNAVFVSINSNGGSAVLDVVAVAGTFPAALIEFQDYRDPGNWVRLDNSTSGFTFGNVTENRTKQLQLRVTNIGSPNAVALSITVSKPPYGVPGIVGAVNNVDLAEGTILAAGQRQTATLFCSVPKSQVNVPGYSGSANWTINTADPSLGKQILVFNCNAVSEQVGPTFSNGTAQYAYVGCFRDNNPSRQLATHIYTDASGNSNDKCISACAAAGWILAGTQYQSECWCGNAIPTRQDFERDCNYPCSGNSSQICGGNGYFNDHARLSIFADTTRYQNTTSAPLSIPATVNGYSYVGCFAEQNGKAMNQKFTSNSTSMTLELCASYCSSYNFFSVEYAQECYCGSSINSAVATLSPDLNCGMTCKGNNSEYCGAGNYSQVYTRNGTSSSGPGNSSSTASASIPSSTGNGISLSGYTYMGCYNETHDRRALNAKIGGGNSNSLESCAAYCLGYSYFGVEHSTECYCANTIYSNSIKQTTDVGCSMLCAGKTNETCGGPDFLSVYFTNSTGVSPSGTATGPNTTSTATSGPVTVQSAGKFNYVGCYSEIQGRALTGSGVANASMTVELCAAFCSAFQCFSVEYSQECYCGNMLASNSLPADGCTMTCAGNNNEFCGGANRMNLYQRNDTNPTTPTNTSASTAGPTVVPTASGFTSLGCYNDVPGRALTSRSFANDSATVEACASFCGGYVYFGVEYSRECYCGTMLDPGSGPVSSGCNMACAGDTSELCGGPGTMNMYTLSARANTTSATVPSASREPVIPPSVGAYVFVGCYTDNVGGRALPNVVASDGMSVETCADEARFTAPQLFGVEYGRECWFGDVLGGSNTLAVRTDCNTLCVGNSSEYCGAGNRLQVYNLTTIGNASTTAGGSSGVASLSLTVLTSSSGISNSSTSASATVSSASFNSSSAASVSGLVSASATANSSMTSLSSSLSVSSTFNSSATARSSVSASQTGSSASNTTFSTSLSSVTSSTRPSSTSSSSSSSFSSSSRTTSVRPTPTATPSVASYTHQGCYNETTSGRALSSLSTTNSSMTPQLCATYCNAYAWFGLEYSSECYCGTGPRPGSALVPTQSDCRMPCAGDPSLLCGGPNRLNMYFSSQPGKKSGNPSVPAVSGEWRYYGCVDDHARILPDVRSADNMTVEGCLAIGRQAGARYVGLEYGAECWYGSALRAAVTNATDSACATVCKGDSNQLCGGEFAMGLYLRNDTRV